MTLGELPLLQHGAAYNGVAEYADFCLTKARDGKWLDGLWFGRSYRTKTAAFNVAMKMASGRRQRLPVVTLGPPGASH